MTDIDPQSPVSPDLFPFQSDDHWKRQSALQLAIKLHGEDICVPDEVINTAEMFLAFLNGRKVTQ